MGTDQDGIVIPAKTGHTAVFLFPTSALATRQVRRAAWSPTEMMRRSVYRCVSVVALILLPFCQLVFAQDHDLDVVQDAALEFFVVHDWVERLEPATKREEAILREVNDLADRLAQSGWKDRYLLLKIRLLLLEEANLIRDEFEPLMQRYEDMFQRVDRKLQFLSPRFSQDRLQVRSHYQRARTAIRETLDSMKQWLAEYDSALRVLDSMALGRFETAKTHFQKANDHRRKSDAAVDAFTKEIADAMVSFGRIVVAIGLTTDPFKGHARPPEREQPARPPMVLEEHRGDMGVVARIVKDNEPAVVLISTRKADGISRSQGSGFVVDHSGIVVTNYHVIQGSVSATARSHNGGEHEVLGVVALNPDLDLAVLKLRGTKFSSVKLGDSGKLAKGEKVVVISSPIGLPNVVSDGLISSLWKLDDINLIQTTAPVSKGSSGSPLFNTKGEVIGITSFILTSGQNLNFAVPINAVKPLIASSAVMMTLGELTALMDDEAESSEPSPPQPSSPASPQTAIRPPSTPPPLHVESPDEMFGSAFKHYERGEYSLAIKGFEAYLQRFPDSSRSPAAHYWLAESCYGAKLYRLAIRYYDAMIKKDPRDHRVPRALLNQGFAYLELNEADRARAVFADVMSKFPGSMEATWAKERLAQIGR